MDYAHAASAAAAGSLDNDRVADAFGFAQSFLRVIAERPFGTRNAWHAGFTHGFLGADLVAHQANGLCTRTDEDETALFDALGEIGIFREKTVPRMNCFGISHLGSADHCRDIQITLAGGRGADTDRFVGELYVFCFAVCF